MIVTAKPFDLEALLKLEDGFVHSDVYTRTDIFELEMEKIFHQGWVYVGHDSEVPQNGDYVLRWIGRQSVIMNRDSNGKIHLFMNRCRHRANSICQFEEGNSAYFRCAYHGWTYKNSGELVGLPFSEGAYNDDFKHENFSVVSVPRIGMHRGFVWGSLSEYGPSLDDYLGVPAKRAIDLFCDHSPEGKITVRHGTNKATIYANWKFQGGDGYHPPFTHQAATSAFQAKRTGREGRMSVWTSDGILSRDLGNGHYCLDIRAVSYSGLPDAPWVKTYRNAMIESYGERRADFIINSGGPHLMLMPNVHLVNPDIRVIRPIAVDHVEITYHCAFLAGVPPEINAARLRSTVGRRGPAGSIDVDDAEMFERNQLGMHQTVNPWKFIGRGLSREHIDQDEGVPEAYRLENTLVGHIADEVTQRAQLRWWASELSGA